MTTAEVAETIDCSFAVTDSSSVKVRRDYATTIVTKTSFLLAIDSIIGDDDSKVRNRAHTLTNYSNWS